MHTPGSDGKEAGHVPSGAQGLSGRDSEAVPSLPAYRMIAYSLANFGYGAFYALNNAVLPLYISHFSNDARLKGLMGSTHSFEGAVIQPLVGSASDRLRTPMGRRRPFMLIFAPLSALLILFTPYLDRFFPHGALYAVVASIFLFTVTFNIAEDPYKALMPDITPGPQRGKVSAVSQLVLVVGQAGLLLLPLPIEMKFTLTAVLMIVTTLLTVWLVREPMHPPETERQVPHLTALREALVGLRTLRQAGLTLAGLFFSGLGIGAIMPFLTTFVKTITHCTDQKAEQMFLVLMISTALTILPFGWLTDRIGSKRVLMIGMVCILIAALNGLWVTTIPQITAILFLAGIGNAAQTASAYPLLTKVVPHEEVGFYTGLQSTALSIASPLTAVLTGELVNKGGYRLIFAVCGAGLVITLVFLGMVRMHAAEAEIAERDREQGRTA